MNSLYLVSFDEPGADGFDEALAAWIIAPSENVALARFIYWSLTELGECVEEDCFDNLFIKEIAMGEDVDWSLANTERPILIEGRSILGKSLWQKFFNISRNNASPENGIDVVVNDAHIYTDLSKMMLVIEANGRSGKFDKYVVFSSNPLARLEVHKVATNDYGGTNEML